MWLTSRRHMGRNFLGASAPPRLISQRQGTSPQDGLQEVKIHPCSVNHGVGHLGSQWLVRLQGRDGLCKLFEAA